MTAPIRLYGFNWHTYPRRPRDVIRCLLGSHRQILRAFDNGQLVLRCSCGAISMDWGGSWSRIEHVGLRRGTPELAGEQPAKNHGPDSPASGSRG